MYPLRHCTYFSNWMLLTPRVKAATAAGVGKRSQVLQPTAATAAKLVAPTLGNGVDYTDACVGRADCTCFTADGLHPAANQRWRVCEQRRWTGRSGFALPSLRARRRPCSTNSGLSASVRRFKSTHLILRTLLAVEAVNRVAVVIEHVNRHNITSIKQSASAMHS
jgi:hypothetical protein